MSNLDAAIDSTLDTARAEIAKLTREEKDVLVAEMQAVPAREIVAVPIIFRELNEAKEPCIYVDGDQTEALSGKVARLGERTLPIIAAVYDAKENRTRVIFPVGSEAQELGTNEIEVEV